MPSSENLWEVRDLPGDLTLELHAGDHPSLILVQGDATLRIELVHARHAIAALTAAASLAELLAAGEVYHA